MLANLNVTEPLTSSLLTYKGIIILLRSEAVLLKESTTQTNQLPNGESLNNLVHLNQHAKRSPVKSRILRPPSEVSLRFFFSIAAAITPLIYYVYLGLLFLVCDVTWRKFCLVFVFQYPCSYICKQKVDKILKRLQRTYAFVACKVRFSKLGCHSTGWWTARPCCAIAYVLFVLRPSLFRAFAVLCSSSEVQGRTLARDEDDDDG